MIKGWKWGATVFTAALLVGCATQSQVSNMAGRGDRRIYSGTFDQVWRAAIDATQRDGLEVTSTDRVNGYIAARRTIRPHTFGENVGVWVRPVGPTQTEIEVVSRQAGPPAFWLSNWEHEIHNSIAANLTREPGVGAASGQSRVIIPDEKIPASGAVESNP